MSAKTIENITARDLEEWKEWALSEGDKTFRGEQVYRWLWQKGIHTWDEMKNVPASLRDSLNSEAKLSFGEVDAVQKSADGTIKARITLQDNNKIEAVLIPAIHQDRYTVCVSSQVGCSLSCKFCATGQMGLKRHLNAGEIVEQVRIMDKVSRQEYSHRLTNIVFMGMGEPLLAYRPVMAAINHITHPKGMNWSPRRITVSTAGIAKAIKRLAADEVRFNLALSLHAANDQKRDMIMPINESNNLEVLMESLEEFYRKAKGKITYEYIALKNFNDTPEDARELAQLCRKFPVTVNIIEYNPVEGILFEKTEEDQLDRFAGILAESGVNLTIRRSRGKDIDAACGQLANK